MDYILLSNISSWVLVTLLLFLVHQYRASDKPYSIPISIGYSVLALSLLANTVFRIIDETYQSVVAGSIVTKISFISVVVLLLLRDIKNKKED